MIEIAMPRLFATMEAGRIVRWLVAEGDRVAPGDPMVEIETGTTRIEIEAPQAGTVLRLLHPAGADQIAVREPILALDRAADGDHEVAGSLQRGDGEPTPPEPVEGMTYRDAILRALGDEMEQSDKVVMIGEGLSSEGPQGIGARLRDRFGSNRVIDAPPTPATLAGLGIGAAVGGMTPVIALGNINLCLHAIEQVLGNAASLHFRSGGHLACPVVFRATSGVVARAGAQHGAQLAPIFARIPGLKVVTPSSAEDAHALLRAAIRDPGPVLFLEHEHLYSRRDADLPPSDTPRRLGLARRRRSGGDVTLIAWGVTVALALDAAELLTGQGVEAEVLDLASVQPLDENSVIDSVRRTGRCVIVEEGSPGYGVGDRVAGLLAARAFEALKSPVVTCADADTPLPYAESLEQAHGPSAQDVVTAVTGMLPGET